MIGIIFLFNTIEIVHATVVPVKSDGNNPGLVVTHMKSMSSRVNLA
ncbi:MAG: hypothetical protein Q8S84_06000 [bacterium]|nr:hypothetical protein [bacterium]